MTFRSEVIRQAKRAELVSQWERAPIHLYAIRETGQLRATVIGASISPAHLDLVRLRGGHCRRICTYTHGRKT